MPANYALQLPADGVAFATTGTLTDIKTQTALGLTLSVRGDRFTGQTDTVHKPIAELAAGYLNIYIRGVVIGTSFQLSIASAVDSEVLHDLSSPINISTIDTAKYYTLKAWWDTAQATNKQGIEIYDDTGTLIGSGYASVATAISNGTFGDVTINKSGGAGINGEGNALTVDWLAAWSGMPPAGAPVDPAVGTSGLLRKYEFNDGTGTTVVESVDNTTGNMTITGTPTWVLISAGSSSPTQVTEDATQSMFPTTLALPKSARWITTVFG